MKIILATATVTITKTPTTIIIKTRTTRTRTTKINGTNENAVYKGKTYKFFNIKTYEEQADQNDLSKRNKSNERINSTQINRKECTLQLTDVKWPEGTAAIVGDSIVSGIIEELLKKNKHNVKVRFFRGGTIEDMEDNIKPILKRKPDYIILLVGTNNVYKFNDP